MGPVRTALFLDLGNEQAPSQHTNQPAEAPIHVGCYIRVFQEQAPKIAPKINCIRKSIVLLKHISREIRSADLQQRPPPCLSLNTLFCL